MASRVTINASALESGFNSNTYYADFFEGLTSGDGAFYGGTPDMAFGGEYYMNGSQHVRSYTDGTDPVSSSVLLDGSDLAYDFIHHGAMYGHGISGAIDGMIFGDWVEGTTTGTQGNGAEGRVTGFGTAVAIDGLGLSAAPGSGSNPETNPTYALYKMVQDMDGAGIAELLSDYKMKIIGTAEDDMLMGGAERDRLVGKGGDDMLKGGAGNDRLFGGRGQDELSGGAGEDRLVGGGGKDTLSGNGGKDFLVGGTGGLGADTFVMIPGGARDVITDFEVARDMIDVSAFEGIASLDDFNVVEKDGFTRLAAEGVKVDLDGVSAEALTNDMFIFDHVVE